MNRPLAPVMLRIIILVGLLALLLVLPTFAQAPPTADTFVSSGTPTTNYGPSIVLVVQPGATSYLKFNLSTLPAGATVSKATLRLYVDFVVKSGSFDVYQLNNSWSEGTLTYNTPPPVLGASATGGHPISITSASLNQFQLIDITTLVQGWVSGSIPNNGVALALTSGSAGNFSFDSKESLLTANGPELEIALSSGDRPDLRDLKVQQDHRVCKVPLVRRDHRDRKDFQESTAHRERKGLKVLREPASVSRDRSTARPVTRPMMSLATTDRVTWHSLRSRPTIHRQTQIPTGA